MLSISRQKFKERWDAMPEELCEAMVSDENVGVAWGVCEREHLNEEMAKKVAIVTGDVMMGFLHIEDLAREIQLATGIHKNIAETIAQEITVKVLTPLRPLIEGMYSPVTDRIDLRPPSLPVAEEETEETVLESGHPKPFVLIEHEPAQEFSVLKKTPENEINLPDADDFSGRSIPLSKEATEASVSAPFVIHEEKDLKPVTAGKRTSGLGGLFGFLKKQKYEPEEVSSFSAPVEAKIVLREDQERQEEDEVEAQVARTTKPQQVHVVDYSDLAIPNFSEESQKSPEIFITPKKDEGPVFSAPSKVINQEADVVPVDFVPQQQPEPQFIKPKKEEEIAPAFQNPDRVMQSEKEVQLINIESNIVSAQLPNKEEKEKELSKPVFTNPAYVVKEETDASKAKIEPSISLPMQPHFEPVKKPEEKLKEEEKKEPELIDLTEALHVPEIQPTKVVNAEKEVYPPIGEVRVDPLAQQSEVFKDQEKFEGNPSLRRPLAPSLEEPFTTPKLNVPKLNLADIPAGEDIIDLRTMEKASRE